MISIKAFFYRHFIDTSIRRKAFLLLGLVVFLSIYILIEGTDWVSNLYSQYLCSIVSEELSYSSGRISAELESIDQLSLLLLSNNTIQTSLPDLQQSSDYRRKTNANKALRTVLNDHSKSFKKYHINYINLYSGSSMASDNSFASQNDPKGILAQVRSKAILAEGRSVWISNYSDSYGLFLGREIREIDKLSLKALGEMVISVDIEGLIAEATMPNSIYSSQVYILTDGTSLLFYSENLSAKEALLLQERSYEGGEIVYFMNHRYLAVNSEIPVYGWNYLCLVPYDEIANQVYEARSLMVLLLLITIVPVILISLLLLSSTTRRMNRLKAKMTAAAKDPATVVTESDNSRITRDEISEIDRQFDGMIRQLNTLIQDNYINQLQLKEAQLQSLQGQINPHFLYNTLDSVHWRARVAGEREISDMVQSLAALLRVTLNKNASYLTIQQEAELAKNYMKIQQYRFEDRLQCSIDLPESIWDIRIPCLCIQPLLENAIRYGLEDNIDDCIIQVQGYQKFDLVHLIVRNTGSEFEEDLLRKLKDKEIQPRGHGIGLLNVDERIRLTYGDEYGLRLYNDGEWAVAEIVLPKRRGNDTC